MTHIPGRLAIMVMALLTCGATMAMAQDEPRFGLVASFPDPTVSFQWELTDRFALRIEGTYTYRDDSSTVTDEIGPSFTGSFIVPVRLITIESRTESTTHTGSIGLAGIFTVHRTDDVRLYVAPRISIGRSTQRVVETTTASGVPPGVSFADIPGTRSLETSSTSPGAGGSLGATVNVHRRLALFGEAGVSYSQSDGPLAITNALTLVGGADSERSTFTTRAVAGAMFLF